MESKCSPALPLGRASMTDTPVRLLIVYARRQGRTLLMREFTNTRDALQARFAYEREHAFDPNVEVVVIGASTIDHLRRTHSKYFHDEL